MLKKYVELENVRFRVYVCDVGLRELLEDVVVVMREEGLFLVKGVVYSVLVLNDKLMLNVMYDDWKYIIGLRV